MLEFLRGKDDGAPPAAEEGLMGSLLAEGERMVKQTAGDVAALAALIGRVPTALKEAVIEASHRLLGSQATGQAITVAAREPGPQAAGGPAPAPAPLDPVQQVALHAGEQLADGGGFQYQVTADGAFEIIAAPPTAQQALHRRLESHGKFAAPWHTLAAKLGVTAAATGPAVAQVAASQGPATTAAPTTAAPTTDSAAASPGAMGTEAGSGLAAVKTNAPTMAGDTLDIAKTRVDLGVENTHYNRTFAKTEEGKKAERQYAADLASGATGVDTFYCSGLSIWTLAAAGYEMSTKMKGSDGVEIYGETERVVDIDAKGKITKDKTKAVGQKTITDKHYVTLKDLIDGSPQAVEIMTLAQQKLGGKGGSVGLITGAGYQVEHEGDELPLAARGAAAAFEFAHIGAEVAETDQKPGDFAQSRRTTKGADDKGTEDQRAHYGAGHAWQVWSTHVRGSAMFGKPGSPKAPKGELTGWHDNVEYIITADTDPATVGQHALIGAQRVEANIGVAMEDRKTDGGGEKDAKGKYVAGDGGVQITREYPVHDGRNVFYGRLSQSKWASWTPATRPAEADQAPAPQVAQQSTAAAPG